MQKLLLTIILLLVSFYGANAQNCSKSSLEIKTGINEDGTIVPPGQQLNFWRITAGPTGTGLYPRRVYCVNTYNGWHTYPNSSWVNLHPTPTTISAGLYNYQRCFCIDSADTFRVKLNIMVDDIGTFYLRDVKKGTRIKLGEANASGWNFFIDTTKNTNYPGTHDDINIDTNLYLTKARYCLDFQVGDAGSGVATGLDVFGSINSVSKKSFAFLKDKCCNDPCHFDNRIDDSSYCENGKLKHKLILNPENKQYLWETGETDRSKFVDISKAYKAHILNVLDGDSCWGYVERNINISEIGYLIDKLKDSICINCKDEIILKCLPFNPSRKWKKDGLIIGNLSFYKATTPGKYCTYYNDSFGCIDSICVDLKGKTCHKSYCDSLASSSIIEPNSNSFIQKDRIELIYNSTSNSYVIKLLISDNYRNYSIKIVDMIGKTILKQSIGFLVNNEFVINVDNFNPGLYFYILEGDEKMLDFKKVLHKSQ